MTEATWWRVKTYGAWLAACVAVLLAFLHGFGLISHYLHSQDSVHLAANIYLSTLFFTVTILAAYRQWVTIRKERYANITPLLHQLLHQIRDLNTFIHTNEPKDGTGREYESFIKDCRIIFGRILDQLNNVFTSLTSTHCRTAIKLTYTRDDKLYVYTLTRDQGSRQKCLSLDNKRVEKNHDPLDENVQFAKLFNNNEEVWHYISNDLTCDDNFRATSVTAYDPEYAKRAPTTKGRWSMPWKRPWPLPYKSTIACVIRQGPFDANQNIRAEVLGFLTVDSESRSVFEERWDVQIMYAVADALYGPVRGYLDAQNRARSVNRQP